MALRGVCVPLEHPSHNHPMMFDVLQMLSVRILLAFERVSY